MKKQLLFGSLLTICGLTHSQNTFPTIGNVGIGTTSPTHPLEVIGSTSGGYGIKITQKSTSPFAQGAILHLDGSINSGGKRWALMSSGPGDAVGVGNFSIYDWWGSTDRFFIQGSTGNVGIGTTAPTPGTKLHVKNNGRSILGESISSGGVGVQGLMQTAGNIIGVWGQVNNTSNIIGFSYGVIGTASGGQIAQGGRFYAFGSPGCSGSTQATGVYATVAYPCTGDLAGLFDGDVKINGVGYLYTTAWTSDQKLKKDIKTLTNGMDKIRLLKPSTYLFKTDEYKDMSLPKEQQIGLIAQDLEKVFPELVTNVPGHSKTNEEGKITGIIPDHKAVNYIGLIPVLISAVQEQDKIIGSQQKQLDEQKQLIAELSQKSGNATGLNNLNAVENGFQMSQNEPNPFTHETVVKYSMPQTINTAFMAVYDLTGKQITTFPIRDKGTSSITITSQNLAAGIYIYSIVADGKVVDSKRMIVADK